MYAVKFVLKYKYVVQLRHSNVAFDHSILFMTSVHVVISRTAQIATNQTAGLWRLIVIDMACKKIRSVRENLRYVGIPVNWYIPLYIL